MEQLRKGLYRDAAGRVRDPFGRYSRTDIAAPPPREQFRLYCFGEPRGPVRDDHKEAMTDAIRAGLASWDAERREHYLAVPVEIRRVDPSI